MQEEGKRKVVYIISHIDKAIGFEWIANSLDNQRFEIVFILLNEKASFLGNHLRENGIRVYEFSPGGKLKLPFTVLKIRRILKKEKADVIHTHMYIADMAGQLAGKMAGTRLRVYTRHSSNENRKYHKKNRIDKFINSLCNRVVAISENVQHILIEEEKVNGEKVRLIHHGFDLKRFEAVKDSDIELLQRKYNPGRKRPVIGVVARYSHWKGIQYSIEAFNKLLASYPNALLILANAKKGDYKDQLAKQLSALPAGSYCEIEFEHDLFALYRLFDVYVHVPIDPQLEAFGQTYVEALAAGVPSVFTLSGVAREFIVNEHNALVVDFCNADEIAAAITRLLGDETLRKTISDNGRKDVNRLFSLEKMVKGLETIYSE
jgi:glycosyltransferase involved in cell wall biosynthesis